MTATRSHPTAIVPCPNCGRPKKIDAKQCLDCWYASKRATPEERFWAKVKIGASRDVCWPWIATNMGSRGYGVFMPGTRHEPTVRAHRYSWELANGPIPAGMSVLHRCDNPPCVNPSHLFLGTQQDNIEDMVAKGRNRPRGYVPKRLHRVVAA